MKSAIQTTIVVDAYFYSGDWCGQGTLIWYNVDMCYIVVAFLYWSLLEDNFFLHVETTINMWQEVTDTLAMHLEINVTVQDEVQMMDKLCAA